MGLRMRYITYFKKTEYYTQAIIYDWVRVDMHKPQKQVGGILLNVSFCK